jgi:two-component system, NarL family, invasion response regulator UvrY
MIRILLADDHTMVREGLKQILGDVADFAVVAEAKNGQEVLAEVRVRTPDVLILDMSMPGTSGIALIRQLKSETPRLPILVLSMHKEEQYAVRAIKAGASGYITKESAPEQLAQAIRKIAGGGVFISPGIGERLAQEYGRPSDAALHTTLSDREYQVFQMLVSGMSINDIASDLCLSAKTISTHKWRILQKMEMSNSSELIHYAIEHQLFEPR